MIAYLFPIPIVLRVAKGEEKYMRAALKVVPSGLSCWPMTSETDFGGMATNIPSYVVAVMAAKGHSDRMASDMKCV